MAKVTSKTRMPIHKRSAKIKSKIHGKKKNTKMLDKKVGNVRNLSNDCELGSKCSDESEVLSDSEIMNEVEDQDEKSECSSDAASDDDSDIEERHKRDLEKLKESDPEFYRFLQENDKKLLSFSVTDDEQDDAEEIEDIHRPTENLAVASDESDFEDDTEGDKVKDNRVITLKMIKKWQSDIQIDKSNKSILELTYAFHAALKSISNTEDDEPSYYKVEGSAVFNAVVQLCVLELGPAVRRFLGMQNNSKIPPHKCKKFVKVKKALKSYFTNLLKLLLGVTSSNIQTILLKHLHYMSNLLTSYPNISKSIVKKLISLWGSADESVRVVAFLCILRITNNNQATLLDVVLRFMYMTYVKNSKFVSLNSLASINFMRRSLVEMFSLDINTTYSHVFLYIRQLAIHLRNAITSCKKENVQAVYNWQFVNSLKLWGNLLSVTYDKDQMKQLVYPFVQVSLGTVRLVPTAQYYPLRFHVLQILMDLSKDTGIFIPILPFLTEVLCSYDFNKKHKKVSMKPILFTCLLRLSKSQLQENGFKDSIIETVYAQLLEYLADHSNSIAFPDLSLISVIQIKQFLKKCKNPNYCKKMRQLVEKIQQNCQFIENERAKVSFNLTDAKQISGWEAQISNQGTPLKTYYESWSKVRNLKRNKQLTNNEELGNYKLPILKKHKKEAKQTEGPVDLFPSDSEDEEKLSKDVKPKRGKRGGKNVNKKIVDHSGPVEDTGEKDFIEDFKMDDW